MQAASLHLREATVVGDPVLMTTLPRIAGFVTLLAIGLGVAFSVEGLSPASFIDVPSMLFVGGGILGILLIGCSSGEWSSALACVFRWSVFNCVAERNAAARFFRLACRASWASGVIALVTSEFIMLGNVSDLSSFTASLSIAALPLLYGMILAEAIFHPLAFALEAGCEEPRK